MTAPDEPAPDEPAPDEPGSDGPGLEEPGSDEPGPDPGAEPELEVGPSPARRPAPPRQGLAAGGAHRRRVRTLRRVRIGTPRKRQPGSVLDCLVLAPGPLEWAAIDLASGAFVRGPLPAPGGESPMGEGWQPFDVARLVIGEWREPLDPSRPEAVSCDEPPAPAGRLRRRQVRHLVRRLASPERPGATLLASHGPSIPYVDLDGTSPSLMLLAVSHRSVEARTRADGQLQLGFSWSGTHHVLPVADARLAAAAARRGPGTMTNAELVAAVGGKPSILLVGLGAVRAGHAPKVVLAALAP